MEQDLYEYVESLEITGEPCVVTFHMAPHIQLPGQGGAPIFVWALGSRLVKSQSAWRLQKYTVDNTVNRYTLLITLRPVHLPDLVNLK